jgi:predicted nucleic acid-binding protein
MVVIANNTVLSNFAFVNRLDLLKSIFGKVFITTEIQHEVENGISEGHDFQRSTKLIIDTSNWLLITRFEPNEQKLYYSLEQKLDIGEASCIVVAIERKWAFLTDDKRARKIAKQYNIKLSGTYGILDRAVKENLILKDEGNFLLKAMIENGYYSPATELL